MTKTDVATTNRDNALPTHLQSQQKSAKIGNVDKTDLIIPHVKLLQSTSPEVTAFDTAKPGIFWHTIAEEPMGTKLIGIPIVVRASIVLWAPRGDDRGVLARSNDRIHWDNPNMEFTVKHKNMEKPVTYFTRGNVAESGLAEFGSKIPGDSNSPPAASLTYNMMWYFPEFKNFSPAIVINTRSSVKPAQGLLSKIDMRPVDHYLQQYEIGVTQETSDDGPYFNYNYTAAGYPDEATCAITRELFGAFGKAEWRANDEGDGDAEKSSGDKPAGKVNEKMASKF